MGTIEVLLLFIELEEGAEVIGGVDLADVGGVAAVEVGVVLADVEILLLLLLGLLLPLGGPDLGGGSGVLGSETPPGTTPGPTPGWGGPATGPPIPLFIMPGCPPMGPIGPTCPIMLGGMPLPGRIPGRIPCLKGGMPWGPPGPPGPLGPIPGPPICG